MEGVLKMLFADVIDMAAFDGGMLGLVVVALLIAFVASRLAVHLLSKMDRHVDDRKSGKEALLRRARPADGVQPVDGLVNNEDGDQ